MKQNMFIMAVEKFLPEKEKNSPGKFPPEENAPQKTLLPERLPKWKFSPW